MSAMHSISLTPSKSESKTRRLHCIWFNQKECHSCLIFFIDYWDIGIPVYKTVQEDNRIFTGYALL